MIGGWGISCEIALILMSLDFTDDQSTLVQVMAWCRQATSHYLSQCWPRSLSPYAVTRPQWVKPIDCLDVKMPSYQNLGIPIDKTVWWPHYLHNGNPYTIQSGQRDLVKSGGTSRINITSLYFVVMICEFSWNKNTNRNCHVLFVTQKSWISLTFVSRSLFF